MSFKGPNNRDPFPAVSELQAEAGGRLEGDLSYTAGLRVRGLGKGKPWPLAAGMAISW